MEVKTIIINEHSIMCQRIENNVNLDPGLRRGDTSEVILSASKASVSKDMCTPAALRAMDSTGSPRAGVVEGCKDPEIPTNHMYESSMYSVIINGTTHTMTASVIAYDGIKKEARFLINNRVITIAGITWSRAGQMHFFMGSQKVTCASPHTHVSQGLSQAIHQSPHAHQSQTTLQSPLAGRVISVLVQQGDAVIPGQPLIIVESMKMENELCSPRHAFIKTISIAPGNLVQTNQVLITFELKGEFDGTTKERYGQATVSDW